MQPEVIQREKVIKKRNNKEFDAAPNNPGRKSIKKRHIRRILRYLNK